MDSMGQTEQERHVTLSESGAYDILYSVHYTAILGTIGVVLFSLCRKVVLRRLDKLTSVEKRIVTK